MTISRPCYATREEVQQALDIKVTARNVAQVDRAIAAASDSVDALTRRVFFTTLATRFVDWPNFQSTYPWRIYLEGSELADVTGTVPVVSTGGASPRTIPAANCIWGPYNYAPPFTRLDLDRSTSSSFGLGSTPQKDVRITGAFGYQDVFAPAGALAVAMTDTTSTTVQVTNGAAVGVGDVLLAGTERMLVTDKVMVTTAQTQQGSGAGSTSNADVTLGVTDGSKFSAGETLLLDSERMLAVDVAGNSVTVKRAWDGSVLAVHSGATVYGLRLLTVVRGALGSTAATHALGAPLQIAAIPGLVKELALAEALVEVTQQAGAYAASQGTGADKVALIGAGLPDLRDRCRAQFGRYRTRSV